MRIGVDALLLGKQDSGVEIYIRELLRALAQIDTTNRYFVYLTKDADPPDAQGNKRFFVRRVPVRSGSRASRIIYQQGVLPRLMGRDRLDTFFSPCYVMPALSSLPTIVTMHDIIAITHPELCKPSNVLHYGRLVPVAAKRAVKIVASSEATKHDIISRLKVPSKKIEVVYPGVSECLKRVRRKGHVEQVRRKYRLPDRYVLFVGNIEPKKNLPILIAAFARLRARRSLPHKLVIVGKRAWKYSPVIQEVKRLKVDSEVICTGYVERDDLPALYTMADVFGFPSIVEGFGMPPLEAMACGVPVVSSRAPALLEAVGDAAICVPHDDVVQLSTAMQKILTNRFLRRTLVRRGSRRAKEFTWRRAATAMLRVFEQVGAV